MKLCFGFCVFASPLPLHSDWDPEECMIDLEPAVFDVLSDSRFKRLKGKILRELKGSWCSEEKVNLLMDLVSLTRPEVCVEIGAFTGSSVLPVAATLKHLNCGKIYAIDAWSNEIMVRNLKNDDPNKFWWSTVNMKAVRKIYNQMVKTWRLTNVCVTIQAPSENAVNQVPEIDFLNLDGDYSEVGSTRDVELYLPKVKPGGYVLLSNVFLVVNKNQPNLKAFCDLFDSCEMICEIERENAILFKKL
jgi:hypothetical protein